MAQPDWLKINEVGRLWSEETGLDASVLRADLESWFAEFTQETSIARQLRPDAPFDSVVANRLLGMLGARYLERRTFDLYCEQRGRPKPRFWSAGPEGEQAPAAAAGSWSRARPTRFEGVRHAAAQDPAKGGSSSPLQTWRRRGTRRGRAVLAAGLAVLLVGLLTWGTETVLRRAGNEPIPQTSEAGLAPPEAAPAGGGGHIIPLDGGQETASESAESAAADADVQGEAERLRADNAQLMDQLAKARAAVESLRAAQQQVAASSDTAARDRDLAATASSAQLAALEAELTSARRQIADLKRALEQAARRRQTTVVQPPEAPRTFVQSAPAGGQADQARAESADYGAEISEVLAGAELPPDAGAVQTVALFDVVPAEDLLLQPGAYADRQVVVTGSVVWLLRRYWLRSDGGQESIMIDVDGLRPDVRSNLEDAVVNIETLTRVRARITGTVEPRGSDGYRLAASELVLLE